jgi:hypothetical protein
MEYVLLSNSTYCRLITIDRFPVATAARTAKTGLAIGLVYGLSQDLLGAAKGRTPGYVDFMLRGRRRRRAEEVGTE